MRPHVAPAATTELSPPSARASRSLLSAAVLGLLCAQAPACSSDSDAGGEPHLTSSQAMELDAAGFESMCDERSGRVEVIPHCGGLNTCKGFSFDLTTGLLSEHTCRGAATCTGWNCVID